MLARAVLFFSAFLFTAGALAQQQQQQQQEPNASVFLCTAFTGFHVETLGTATRVNVAVRDIPQDSIGSICDKMNNWFTDNANLFIGISNNRLNCYGDKGRRYLTMGVAVPTTLASGAQVAVNFVIGSLIEVLGESIGTQNVTSTTDCLVVDFEQAQFDGNKTNTDDFTVYPSKKLQFNNQAVVVQSVQISKGALTVQLPEAPIINGNLGPSVDQLSNTGRTIGTSDANVVGDVWLKVMYDTLFKGTGTVNIDITGDQWQDLIGKLVNTLALTARNGEDCIAMSATKDGDAGSDLDLMLQVCFTN